MTSLDPSKGLTRRVQALPEFDSIEKLADFLARAAWHFSHIPEIELYVALAPDMQVPKKLNVPEGFSPEVQPYLDAYLSRVKFLRNRTTKSWFDLASSADIVLRWVESNQPLNSVIARAKKPMYRVDPAAVRQEGSFFIQCGFDLCGDKQRLVEESKVKFQRLVAQVGQPADAWVMATGPSVESFATHDFNGSLVIACNSVVLNDALMRHCRPAILVFADPIFHFGVSQYAGRFREVVAERLSNTAMAVIVPLKYYPLLLAKFPKFADRLIGVPFEVSSSFLLDLNADFRVKTTANILTLLLLPVAATFSKDVKLIGCDGRPFDQDDYFWGHGESVQINDKMENIKQVHPGFFDIDYNEYYFEHCHTLANLLRAGELRGIQFSHFGDSYIPALRDRSTSSLIHKNSKGSRKSESPAACIVLEPDGIGHSGHYVRWHNQLVAELRQRFSRVDILCHEQQDASLYDCPAKPTFSVHSWDVHQANFSFSRKFTESAALSKFVTETMAGICAVHDPLPSTLTLYAYYGSVQMLLGFHQLRRELRKLGTELRVFMCLFSESVISDPAQPRMRLPPNAKEILLEAAALVDNYRIASVTQRLSDLLYEKFGAWTEVFPNPVPGRSDAQTRLLAATAPNDAVVKTATSESVILFPCRLRDEKGSTVTAEIVATLGRFGVPSGQRYIFRGDRPAGTSPHERMVFCGDEWSDEEYWDRFAQADVVVIPYLAPPFTYRTSGILADALSMGVPSIVFEDTWLADQVAASGAGLVVKYRSEFTLSSAIKVVLSNRSLLKRNAIEGFKSYAATHSWARAADFALMRAL